VAEVVPGQPYRLDACLTVTAPGLQSVSLRLAWYEEPHGYGPSYLIEDSPANPGLVGGEQCLSLTNANAPCPTRSVRYGVIAVEDTTAVTVSSLQLSLDPAGTPEPCATPTAEATATTAPTPPVTPAASSTPQPPPDPTPAPQAAAEPAFFPSLVNGGFEELRSDGTPYGWHKVGGEMSAASAVHYRGRRAASLTSRTDSTKWLFETVSVRGGSYYRLQAMALKDDSDIRDILLRVSWYASADGSGRQLSTADSQPLTADAPRFVALDTPPVQAPAEARSARARLLLRPVSGAPATAYFDDVSFQETAPPSGAGTAAAPGPESAGTGGRSDPVTASTRQAVAGTRAGPAVLVNERPPRTESTPAAAGGDRPLWPVLLALGIPAAGLALTAAGHAWRSRLAGGIKRHL
jgi:hypothetical protein